MHQTRIPQIIDGNALMQRYGFDTNNSKIEFDFWSDEKEYKPYKW